MRVCLASNNPHKRREIGALIGDSEVISPQDLGVGFSAEETGSTFLANALIKATSLWEALQSDGHGGRRARVEGSEQARGDASHSAHEQLIVLADDSGLCVDALDGRPGVHSARYGVTSSRPSPSSEVQNKLLLEEMEGRDNRAAHFICCMVAIIDRDRIITVQERWSGQIAHDLSSSHGGFGYDPVFYLPDFQCTAADLPTEKKNELSHRGRAAAVIQAALDRARRLSNV